MVAMVTSVSGSMMVILSALVAPFTCITLVPALVMLTPVARSLLRSRSFRAL